jgi:hypothetical protein
MIIMPYNKLQMANWSYFISFIINKIKRLLDIKIMKRMKRVAPFFINKYCIHSFNHKLQVDVHAFKFGKSLSCFTHCNKHFINLKIWSYFYPHCCKKKHYYGEFYFWRTFFKTPLAISSIF